MKPLKMYTPERIALLILAAAIVAWALVCALTRDNKATPIIVEVHDTVTIIHTDTIQTITHPGTRPKDVARVPGRNHLDERVETE